MNSPSLLLLGVYHYQILSQSLHTIIVIVKSLSLNTITTIIVRLSLHLFVMNNERVTLHEAHYELNTPERLDLSVEVL
jgi:hypothetical protein